MLTINIICIGKIKENYLREACAEYSKRLSKYCNLNIIELPDEKLPNNLNETFLNLDPEELSKNREEDRELNKLPFKKPSKSMSNELRELLYGKKYEPKKIEKKIIKPKKSNFEK